MKRITATAKTTYKQLNEPVALTQEAVITVVSSSNEEDISEPSTIQPAARSRRQARLGLR